MYWDYYCFVKEYPILKWNVPTYILQGENDDLCEYDIFTEFTKQFSCKLKIAEAVEHYFYTQSKLTEFSKWLEESM